MLVVKLCIWPGGDPSKERVEAIGTLTCVGIAQQDAPEHGVQKGDRAYRVRLLKSPKFKGPDGSDPKAIWTPDPRQVWKEGFVMGHKPGARGAWDLLGAALRLLESRLEDYTVRRTDAFLDKANPILDADE